MARLEVFTNMLVKRARNVLRGLVHRYGTLTMKKRLWDTEFATGRWDCLDSMAEDCLYPYIEKYVNRGSILDLGCGPGATGNELRAEKYSFYTGVDISEVAVEKARRRTEQNRRDAKNRYFQSDIFTYEPPDKYDVIVFGDSIYYVPEQKIGFMLQRYSSFLNPGGVFIVRVKGVRREWWGAGASGASVGGQMGETSARRDFGSWARRRNILSTIENEFSVIERGLHDDFDVICVLVFRPTAQLSNS